MTRKKVTKITVEEADLLMTHLDDILVELIKQEVNLPTGSGVETLTVFEMVIRSIVKSAINGNGANARFIVNIMMQAERMHAQAMATQNTYWAARQKELHKEFGEHMEKYGCEPEIYPHPDDIVLDPRKGARIRGPYDKATALHARYTAQVIDALLWQHALEACLDKVSIDEPLNRGALFLALFFETSLPERMHIPSVELVTLLSRRGRMPKRQLLKETYRAWQLVGFDIKRGARFKGKEAAIQFVDAASAGLKVLNDKSLDEDEKTEELMETLQRHLGGGQGNGS